MEGKLCNPNKSQLSQSSIIWKEMQPNSRKQLKIKPISIARLREQNSNTSSTCPRSLPTLSYTEATCGQALTLQHKQNLNQVLPQVLSFLIPSVFLNLYFPALYLVDLINFCIYFSHFTPYLALVQRGPANKNPAPCILHLKPSLSPQTSHFVWQGGWQ